MTRIKSLLPDFFAIVVLVLSGLLLLQGFSDRIDINLTDDTGYLTLGLRITQGVLAGFGPLYSVFFKVLKQIFNDHVVLYDAAIIILSIAPAVFAYIFLRAFQVNRHWALLFSGLFLFSSVNMAFITWSKISHYSICIVFLWAALASRWKDAFYQVFLLFVAAFLLGYVRPEYHLSWYLSGVLLLGAWFVSRKFSLTKKDFGFFALAALLIAVFLFIVGNPMAGNRTFTAFAQQFSYNYCEWNQLNNFDWIQWRDIAEQNFGTFETLGEAYKNNPEVFKQHIVYNIQQYFIKGFNGVSGIFFPPAILSISPWLAWLIIVSLTVLRLYYVGFSSWKNQALEFIRKHIWIILGLLILSAPSVVASFVFYTREHYLVLQMPLVFMIFAIILYPKSSKAFNRPRILTYLALPAVAILLLFIRPDLSKYKTFDVWDEYTYPSNRATIEAVRKLNITDQEIREMDHEGGFAIYIGKNYRWVNLFNKTDISFEQFRKETETNMVYVTKALLSNRFFSEDSTFVKFIENPEAHGFYRMNLSPENKGYLLLSDSLKVN